ncbi:hypothetical protein HPJ92_12475 [Anoxybacillus flavithermus]|uniref:hypothetical protein n=1 Tax=Anoxybacillus flavithermus TaxID=33934 RepID=UPI0018696404|nr:hypothetical protein [Anoxybacillus flavithermus]MBE2933233.1 hypothetical protein [Anoxybacillus flavithermus]
MRKNTIIEHQRFKQILQYRPAVTEEADRNHLKMTMLKSIIQVIGEKWARMKDETKSALEYLCFLSIERGFVYAGSYHVSERYDIDSSTVRRYIAFLEQKGVIKRLWRSSSKQNGRGKAVIFFTAHPYFEKYWQTLFFSHLDEQAHAQAENVENDRIIEGSDAQNAAVPYTSPDQNNNNNHVNVSHSDNKPTFVKFVSKEVNRIVNGLFNAETIKQAWNRVTLAFRKAVQTFGNIITHADRKKVAISVFASLKQYWMQRKGQMQTDEICALAYSIASKQFEQLYHSRQPKEEQKPIRTEMLPDWFESYQRSLEEYMKPKNEVYDEERIERLREKLKRTGKMDQK